MIAHRCRASGRSALDDARRHVHLPRLLHAAKPVQHERSGAPPDSCTLHADRRQRRIARGTQLEIAEPAHRQTPRHRHAVGLRFHQRAERHQVGAAEQRQPLACSQLAPTPEAAPAVRLARTRSCSAPEPRSRPAPCRRRAAPQRRTRSRAPAPAGRPRRTRRTGRDPWRGNTPPPPHRPPRGPRRPACRSAGAPRRTPPRQGRRRPPASGASARRASPRSAAARPADVPAPRAPAPPRSPSHSPTATASPRSPARVARR